VKQVLPTVGLVAVVVRPLDAAGKQRVETTKIALMEAGRG
jgi:hypothetical protein